ncbi:hypothetical protein DPMN_119118 [Dreissena polymorpha]|uniref:Uncharacterized protein n=1 Tax=Dreissena polymorpha TaxID=45954 RepID=A0A9D4JP47_DREPO|nr:hypothetical protein DPMN_119118 [Dreissena polymorpha]
MPFKVQHVLTVPRVILALAATSIAVVVVNYLRVFVAVRNESWNLVPKSDTWKKFFTTSHWVSFSFPAITFIYVITGSLIIWIKLRTSFVCTDAQKICEVPFIDNKSYNG